MRLNILPLHLNKFVVNLIDTLLDDVIHSTLLKGLNFGISPLVLPTEDTVGALRKTLARGWLNLQGRFNRKLEETSKCPGN
jgi:hypothetical protein